MTVDKIAVLFPGQGAYFEGALAEVTNSYAETGGIFGEIDEVAQRLSGGAISGRIFNADGQGIDDLLESAPDLLQLAMYGTSVAAYRMLRAHGLTPGVLVGHSFGEIAALVCAGAFSVAEGAEIIAHRTAVLRAAGELDGYMAALSTDVTRAERILRLIDDPDTVVAVENHERQTVISGRRKTVDAATAIAGVLGLGMVTLKSPYPFHSPMLADAATEFARRTRHIPQRRLEVEVYSPILGRAYRDTDDFTAELAGHLTTQVRFADAVRSVHASGVGAFIECGALDALTKITKRVLAGHDHLARSVLLPTSTLSVAITELTDAGVLATERPTDAIRLALTPGVESAEFERLWDVCGPRIAQFARSELRTAARLLDVVDAQEVFAPADAVMYSRPTIVPDPVAAPAAAAAPVTAPAAPEGGKERPSRAALFGELVRIYADALEYPPEVFDEETDLEAELGVDSVKQTELLGRIGETYNLGPLPADFKLGEHNTLGRIADLIAAA
ncbi:acyltransferase domain-containing protein [Nocardia sp. NPDC052566]|uniref:acyltransferase domain-containing protein n=1 Tax=Nocardia sp. NPDC052566 TaxID=3364330 RepID=UPI0037C8F86D